MPETMGNISIKAPHGLYQEFIWFSVPVCTTVWPEGVTTLIVMLIRKRPRENEGLW